MDRSQPDLADGVAAPAGPVTALPVADTGESTRSRVARLLGSGTTVMLAGTVVATVGAYLFQLLGGRVLGPAAFAPVTVLWSVQFLVMTVVMVPVEQLVIRRMELTGGRSSGLRDGVVVVGALLLGTTVCVVPAMAVLGGGAYALMAGLLVAGYTVFAAARGHLAGRHRYRDYGIATAAEAVGRLLLAAAVLLVTRDGLGLAAAMVLAPLCVLVARPFVRSARAEQADDDRDGDGGPAGDVLVGSAGRFLLPLVLANGAAQTVLGGGPIVVAAIGAGPLVVSAVFVTFTLFRGPLWIIQSVLARVLPPFTALALRGEHATLRRWALRLAAMGAVLGTLAGPVGWWLGPGLVGTLFGTQFTPSAPLAALAASGTALAATTALSAQVLVAVGATWRVALAWTVALAVAALALVPAGPADVRVGLAFLAGEVTALVVMTVLAVTPLGRAPSPPDHPAPDPGARR